MQFITQSIAYTWGTRPEERTRSFPCDRHLPDADLACFRALNIDAPPAVVFRWLCQLKIAPYSYDWIDNFGRRSPRTLTPGLERLAVGQHAMTLFEIVEFETDRHITAVTLPTIGESLFGRMACSYVVVPRQRDALGGAGDNSRVVNDSVMAAGGSRLLVKLLARRARGPLSLLMRAVLPWGDLVMMRKQLLNLKELAEQSARK